MLLVGACARPVGDFGRAEASFTHDEVLPGLGEVRAGLAGEPVSTFNQTDEEREMADRAWRFLIAPHAKDWFFDIATEMRRTRLVAAEEARFSIARYYQHLSTDRYRSSRVRFRRLEDDIKADIATVPGTFAAVCAVLEIDHRRSLALREMGAVGPDMAAEAAQRRAENAAVIGWLTEALRYRHGSYRYALDHLLVETPHEEARAADHQLALFEPYVIAAERGQFCGFSAMGNRGANRDAIEGRVLMSGMDGNYRK